MSCAHGKILGKSTHRSSFDQLSAARTEVVSLLVLHRMEIPTPWPALQGCFPSPHDRKADAGKYEGTRACPRETRCLQPAHTVAASHLLKATCTMREPLQPEPTDIGFKLTFVLVLPRVDLHTVKRDLRESQQASANSPSQVCPVQAPWKCKRAPWRR